MSYNLLFVSDLSGDHKDIHTCASAIAGINVVHIVPEEVHNISDDLNPFAILVSIGAIDRTNNLIEIANYSKNIIDIPVILIYNSDIVQELGAKIFTNSFTLYKDDYAQYIKQIPCFINYCLSHRVNPVDNDSKNNSTDDLSLEEYKIVFIDDNKEERNNIKRLINNGKMQRYKIYEFDTLFEGFQKAIHTKVDCIIIDIDNIASTWNEIMKIVNSGNFADNFPIILLSKKENSQVFNSAIKNNISYCFIKQNLNSYWFSFALKNAIEKYNLFNSLSHEKDVHHYQETHDDITDTLTRSYFNQQLREKLKDETNKMSFVYAGIDNFSILNEFIGQAKCDKLLEAIAKNIQRVAPTEALISRYSGDEFIIAFFDASVGDKNCIIKSIQEGMNLVVDEYDFQLTSSIGCAVYPEHGDTVDVVSFHAYSAMKRAKTLGRNNIVTYDIDLERESMKRKKLILQIKHAIMGDRNIITLIQSRHDAKTRKICGGEILSRWNHEDIGTILPKFFMDIIKESGCSAMFDMKNIKIVDKYLDRLTDDVQIAVNITEEFLLSNTFINNLERLVLSNHASKIILELPHTILHHISEDLINKIKAIKKRGLKVAIDDFGFDLSHLDNLSRLPVDMVIIDNLVIKRIVDDPKKAAICKTIIATAVEQKMTVLAENVETKEQADLLTEYGCDILQGYYFSRPSSLEKFIEVKNEENIIIKTG